MQTVSLDFFLSSHLGDALCATPLPRQMFLEQGISPQVIRHRSTITVFANSPYISGYTHRRSKRLFDMLRGNGHMIQRLQRGFQLTITDHPKPEIYLSAEEQRWAAEQRAQWPANRPVCLLSTRVVTNARQYLSVDWPTLAQTLQERCTIVQPVISDAPLYRQQIGLIKRPEEWTEEPTVPGAIVYRDLPLRHYMALFNVVDYFCGGLAGGAHVAAAFDVPALVVIWPELAASLRFPSTGHRLATENWAYPYHHYLDAQWVRTGHPIKGKIQQAIQSLYDQPRVRIPLPSTPVRKTYARSDQIPPRPGRRGPTYHRPPSSRPTPP